MVQMTVRIGTKTVRLDKRNLIGSGGEGAVFRYGKLAIKVYYNPTPERDSKLKMMIQQNWQLPQDKVGVLTDLVYEPSGTMAIGPVMPYLGTGFEEVSILSNSRKRALYNASNESITELFIDGARTLLQIHSQKLVIGDFNDKNQLFRAKDMVFIDFDAFQYDRFPCPVGTEQFLVPELYNKDLSKKPYFTPDFDWYSFAVMFFKSLLMTHPYGGVHPQYKKITERALKRITLFNNDVVYPKMAQDPAILTPDLRDIFNSYFEKGWRGPFPIIALENFLRQLTGKPIQHPAGALPQTIVSQDGVIATSIIKTNGVILYFKLVSDIYYVIAHENDRIVLYSYSLGHGERRQEIFAAQEVQGSKFEIFDKYLVLNPALSNGAETKLLIFEITGSGLKHVTSSEADQFSARRQAMFRTNGTNLYRIVGNSLMEGKIQYGQLIEKMIRSVDANQTWFSVDTEHLGENPSMFGFFQVLTDQFYWYRHGNNNFDVMLPKMERGEVLRGISVKYSSQGAMVRRLTELHGVEYQRIDLVNTKGQVDYSSPRHAQDQYKFPIGGMAYSTGKALHPTDEGIVLEDIQSGNTKLFGNTKPYMAAGYNLLRHQNGIVVVSDSQVIHLELV